MTDCKRVGQEASPTAGVIDSQTVKAPIAEKRGYDAGNKIVGRKRHIAVNPRGRLLAVNLTTADISDSADAQPILDAIRKRRPWVKHFFADGAYNRRTLLDKTAFFDFVVVRLNRCRSTVQGHSPPLGGRAQFLLADAILPPRPRL